MTLNHKFLAQMRAATRSLMRRGPAVARTVIRESVKNAAAVQTAAVKSVDTMTPPASNHPTYDAFSDMLADLSRLGQNANPFNVPPLSTGAGNANGPSLLTVVVSAPLASVTLAPDASPDTVPPIVERMWTMFCALETGAQLFASRALTLNAKAPDAVGVPDSVPSGDSVKPSGAMPSVTLKVSGGVPPVAVNVVDA